jgi:hypothetical protein
MESHYHLISETSPNSECRSMHVRFARIFFVPNMIDKFVPYKMKIVFVDKTIIIFGHIYIWGDSSENTWLL